MSKYIDVTIPISQDMAIFRGDPPVELDAVSSVKKGDPCNVTGICMGSHTGTHVDAPSHFFSSGKTVDEIPLDLFIGPARVFQMRGHKSISRDLLESLDMEGCSRVLFKTDHSYLLDRYTRFRPDYVHLSVDACGFLVQKGVRLVGIDSFSVEKFESQDNMCHKILLGAGVIILELLNLREVDPGDYEMLCLPLNIQKGDGAPARVVLKPLEPVK